MLKNIIYKLTAFSLLLCSGGCAAGRGPLTKSLNADTINIEGIYHKVQKKQTLWRISKMYNTDLDEIIRLNNISNPAQINAGQTIFIPKTNSPEAPGAAEYKPLKQDNDFIWPAKGKVIVNYGEKLSNSLNKGITIHSNPDADILAANSGVVVFTSQELKSYGKTIVISHYNGIMTVYALLSKILVKPGEQINQGSSIAKSENGIVHFEIRKGHISQNPYYFLAR